MAQDLCFSEEMTILIWYCLYDVKEEIRVTLYELTEEYLKLLDTKKAIDESKVETDIKTAIQKKLIKKMESYLKVRQTLNAEIKALKEEKNEFRIAGKNWKNALIQLIMRLNHQCWLLVY